MAMAPQVERRVRQDPSADKLFDFMRELQDDLRVFSTRLQHLEDALISHMKHEERSMKEVADRLHNNDTLLAQMDDKIDALSQVHVAFPHEGGAPDLIEHRMYHEKKNREAEDHRELALDGKKIFMGGVIRWGMHFAQLAFMFYVFNHLEKIV